MAAIRLHFYSVERLGAKLPLTMGAVNYLRYLNSVALARKPSPIRKLTEILANSPPSMISLAGGMPNATTFPFRECEIKTKDGSTLKIG